jgi:hypothetical protein
LIFGGAAPARTLTMVRPDGDTTRFIEASRASLTTAQLADYVGTYASEELDVRLDVAIKDDRLVLRRRPADEMAMRPMYVDDFASPVGTIRFSRDASGRVTGFAVFNGRIRDVRFTKR